MAEPEKSSLPRRETVDVTVLLATANRAQLLEQTLGHFGSLDTNDLTWQIVVVDNGSMDATASVLEQASRRLPLIGLHEPDPGKNRALNRGLPHARGELLVFTDDDVVPDRQWLRELVRAAKDWPTHEVFAGRITPRFPTETPEWVRTHPFGEAAYARFDLPQTEGPTETLAFGPNFAVRASVTTRHQFAERIGPQTGKNYAMGSETEFLLRLQRAGHRTVYVPSARVEHVIQPGQTTPEWLLGRSFRLGRGLTRLGLSNAPRPPRIFGIPAYLLPTIVRTWLRYRLSPLLGWRRRFDVALEYQFLLGSLHELRLLAAEEAGA